MFKVNRRKFKIEKEVYSENLKDRLGIGFLLCYNIPLPYGSVMSSFSVSPENSFRVKVLSLAFESSAKT